MRMRAYERALWKSKINEEWFVSFFKYLKPVRRPAVNVDDVDAPNDANAANAGDNAANGEGN